jgi:biotin transport system substrate-specific component
VSTDVIAYPHPRRPVLADLAPAHAFRDLALVLGGAGLTTIGAQISIHVPGSPVPVTGQTLGVVIAGAALGAWRGALSQLVYVVVGLLLPIYADGAHGWPVVWGATGGYLVGFVVAAGVIGWAAERGADRDPLRATVTYALGQLVIFAIGVPWLKVATGLQWSQAIHYGFTVFVLGGVIKAALAGVLTPAAWRLVHRVDAR